ncbi:hypothetical protein [Actinophytocola sediminis]
MSTTSAAVVPPAVRNATLAVWAILGLLVLRVILTFAFHDDLVDAYIGDRVMARELAEYAAPAYSGVAIAVLVIGAILALAAINLGRAAQWARIVAVVFAGLCLLGVVASLVAPTIAVLLIINVVVGLLAVGFIVLIFSGEANRFFAK